MSPAVASFVASLAAYDPTGDASPIATLYSMVEPIVTDPSVADGFAHVFAFFERYPEADLGSPGPLVHLIERHVGRYEDLLIASLKRMPSIATITMAHRILNAHRSTAERTQFLQLLAYVRDDQASSDHVRAEARHYYEYQTQG